VNKVLFGSVLGCVLTLIVSLTTQSALAQTSNYKQRLKQAQERQKFIYQKNYQENSMRTAERFHDPSATQILKPGQIPSPAAFERKAPPPPVPIYATPQSDRERQKKQKERREPGQAPNIFAPGGGGGQNGSNIFQ